MTFLAFPRSPIVCKNLVNGLWQDDSGLPTREILSPYNGQLIAHVPMSTRHEVDKAVECAQRAWPQWHRLPLRNRAEILRKFRTLLVENLPRLIDSVALESGKTRVEAEAGLQKGIEIIDFAISLPNTEQLTAAEVSLGVYCQFRRESLGVVAGITPFNFPAMVPLWMIPLALVVGNAFILKPSEKVSRTPQILGELLISAGIPAGVFSIVNGGAEVVDALVSHQDVQALGFVGSTHVARHVYTQGTAAGKRVLALGGAKNHLIVTPDCDLESTAKGILSSFTGCAGQRCMAASVLLAVGDVEPVLQRVAALGAAQVLGRDVGALIDKSALVRIESAIEEALRQGANLLLDGRGKATGLAQCEQGYWLGATILDNATPEMQCAQSEIFGPVLTVIRVKSLEEAVRISNQSPYGNAASVFTSRGDVAQFVTTHSNAGMIGINIGVPVPREPFSFGGTKQSRFGHGDITGQSGIDFWSDLKKITTTWPTFVSAENSSAGRFLLHTT